MTHVKPLCSVFGQCGGCEYQDISYQDELTIKEKLLKAILNKEDIDVELVMERIVASPKHYHYRNRLDLRVQRTKTSGILVGFTPPPARVKVSEDKFGILPIDECPIAMEPINRVIAQLRKEAVGNLPPKYYRANIVVRSDEAGHVRYGGIGRKSCQLRSDDYFSTIINGRKIFYSLDTFFQANLSILPKLFEVIGAFKIWGQQTSLYDLYGGVGLFTVGLYDLAGKITLIEESPASITVARHNISVNNLKNIEIIESKVEDKLEELLKVDQSKNKVAFIDPPRVGLSRGAREFLTVQKNIGHLLYLSCNPEALAGDLKALLNGGWALKKIVPFDFFPRTKHLEVLALLEKNNM